MTTPKQQDRLDRMYQAALDEFSQQGFHLANVDSIALKAGVSKATLYSHFGTKEKLFLEIFERGFERILDCSQQTFDLRKVGLEHVIRARVLDFLTRVADSAETRLFFHCVSSDSAQIPNHLQKELTDRFIASVLGEMNESREAKEASRLFTHLDLDFFHNAIIGMLLQVLRFWWKQKRRWPIDRLAGQVADFILFGASGPQVTAVSEKGGAKPGTASAAKGARKAANPNGKKAKTGTAGKENAAKTRRRPS